MSAVEKCVKYFVRAALVVSMTMLGGGCASFYVDKTVAELMPQEKVAISHAQPAQVLFEFQTKGVLNGQATTMVKDVVWNAVQSSGLFSQISADPVPGGTLVHVTINNVPLTDDAFAKGFATGFTLGLVGNTVADGYVCTIDYLPGDAGAQKLTTTTHDAIYTSLGATASVPPNGEKMASITEAVNTMARRVVANGLNDLAKNSAFPK